MKGDNSPDDDDLVFRILLDSEERSDVSGPSSTKDLSQAAARRLACLKVALESIRIASSDNATPIENMTSFQALRIITLRLVLTFRCQVVLNSFDDWGRVDLAL